MLTAMLCGCSDETEAERSKEDFDRNVESCVCRHLEWETDSYSRLPYEDMVQICNETVLSSNPNRYPKELNSRPKLVDLRCQEDVEPWLEAVEENRVLEESNRRLFEEVKQQIDQDSSEENDS